VRAPEDVGLGNAKVTLSFPAWKEGNVATATLELPVVQAVPAPKQTPPDLSRKLELEAVSTRLKGSLIHPNKKAVLYGLRYSPDGKRIIAGDYPGGVLQVWDTVAGKQLAKIETGSGYRAFQDYFFLSPEWKTVYEAQLKGKPTLIKSGKKRTREEFEGAMRAWSLDTGELRHTFEHDPPRGIFGMVLSPDGATLATFEQVPGESEDEAKASASLWDVKTRQYRLLPEGRYGAVFAPDGKTLATPADTDGGRRNMVSLLDVATAKVKAAIPIALKGAVLQSIAYSPDGNVLVGQVFKPGESWLKLWDPATGQEVASFECPKNDLFQNDMFLWMAFSPDSRTLAVTNWRGEPGKLFVFDLPSRKLVKTVILAEKGRVGALAFSPDGKWMAATTQSVLSIDLGQGEPNVEDLPQPRIHLVDAAACQVRETIVAPQGVPASVCFSPDGKTLASGGHGRVLLWDLR
jgi:WD40 repeat protein